MSFTRSILNRMRARDIKSLHKMYDSLSLESKRIFHPGFIGFRSISFRWLVAQIILIASTIKSTRNLPIYMPIVAISERKEIAGFAYLFVKRRFFRKDVQDSLGIVVKKNHEGKGIGSRLMSVLLMLARREKN